VAHADISIQKHSFKSVPHSDLLAFESWAKACGYDIAPAVSHTPVRLYADRNTQAAYEAWSAGIAHVEAARCAK
jgi:hypothetical protein